MDGVDVTSPRDILLVALAGCVNRHQLAIAYLREENRVPKEVPGRVRISLSGAAIPSFNRSSLASGIARSTVCTTAIGSVDGNGPRGVM
jgi:hypothetical protein